MTYNPRDLVDIDASYENVSAVCPKCGVRNTFNRASDIGHFSPIDGLNVVCQDERCAAPFRIGGDLVNSAHEMLVFDSDEFFRTKRYMQAILSACTAFEVFFLQFVRVTLVFRPAAYAREERDEDDLDWLNDAITRVECGTRRFTYGPLRQLFFGLVVDGVAPRSLAEANAAIGAIPKWPPTVDLARLKEIEGDRRELLLRVHESTLGDVRNKVVHKSAYRPTRDEAQRLVHEAWELMPRLTRAFDVHDDLHHLNATIRSAGEAS